MRGKNKIKIVGFLILILLCLTSVKQDIFIETAISTSLRKAINDYGGPNLDFDFIYKVVENLSYIVKKYPMGRDFGTKGEHYARDLIVNWMQEIGLQNVHTDKITGEWTKKDSWQNIYNFILDPDYYSDPWIEELDLKKNFTKWYLHVKVYDNDNNLIEDRNFSKGTCFPFLNQEKEDESHNVTMYGVKVIDDFQLFGPDGIILIESDWRDPYGWWNANLTKLRRNNVKGFILMDCFDDTIFMMPSGTSSPLVPRLSKPGFSINGSNGKWIKNYLNNPDFVVKADFCSEWAWERVDSWNIIGEIPGNSSKVAIINDFYDGWWNQATCDETVGVGLILGIAKYLIDNNIKPELTLRFITWGGHEWYFRGAKHYLKNNSIKKYLSQSLPINKEEDIIYTFNPGNFGFNYTYDMSFNVGHKRDDSLMKYMQSVAEELMYTERTGIGITGDYSVYGTEGYRFYHGHKYPERYCNHAIEFDRFPYPGYHRDGSNHTKGDVFTEINDTLFRVDCEVIAEIIMRLTVPQLEINIVSPEPNSFYLDNFRLLPLLRKTIVYGPMKIDVDIESDNEIDRVEFYIDGEQKKIVTDEPFTYYCKGLKCFMQSIKVVAYDINGNYADDEIEIFKWRLHPLLILSGFFFS